MKKSLLLILIILLTCRDLYTQWYKVNSPDFYTPISLDTYDDKNCIFSTTIERSLFITKDGGLTWNKIVNINGADDSEISDVSMVNPEKIYLAAANGKIIATSNAGETWQIQFENSTRTKCISYIEMFDENNGIAFGEAIDFASAVILNTTNGGQNWNYVDNNDMVGWGTVDYSRRIDFVDINTGYFKPAITYNAPPQTIFKTTNGGLTWESTDLIFPMYALKFYNADFGMAAGFIANNNEFKGCLIISKDGGATFDTVLVGTTAGINSIEFHKNDPSKVWCSNNNSLFYSADSGKSWKEQSFLFGPKPGFQHIKFVDNSIGWIAANGFILRTTNAGSVFTSVENEISLPNNFQLYQNYPNPFNPSTTIKYSIPVVENQPVATKLKVYDLLGSEVAVLVNEEKAPGNYEVKFDGTGLPNGIYFYRLQAGDYTSTRKMLLIK